ncbi:MAG: VTT domain-containing protein [Pseudomonadota bacterium]
MQAWLQFFNRMDASAWRAIGVTLGLFALVSFLFMAGRAGGLIDVDALQEALAALRASPFGLAIVIGLFCVGAFLGAPQFGLIAAVVVAFGPRTGFAYAWIATLASGALTFWTGRWAGEATFRRYAGASANRLSAFVGRNAFVASAFVRIVPTAPFIMVNMAFGVSRSRFLSYWAGLAVGVVPKTALVAFAGQGVFAALSGSPVAMALAGLAVAVLWIFLMLAARRRLRGRLDDFTANPTESIDMSKPSRDES